MDIGERLRELREARGFSQGDIEKRTGLLRCYVSRVENGHTVPNLATMEKWAKALDVELYQLFFFGEGKPKAPKPAEPAVLGRGDKEALRVFSRLAESDRRLLFSMARKMAARAKRRTKPKTA